MQSVVNLGGDWWEKCVECDVEYPIYNVLIVFVATHRKRKNKETEK